MGKVIIMAVIIILNGTFHCQSGAKTTVEDVGKELRCPTCQGLSVLESETPQSNAMRLEIAKQVAEGKSKEQVIAYFKQRYGAWILREPDIKSPLGFAIWLIPILGFILGPIVIFLTLLRRKKTGVI